MLFCIHDATHALILTTDLSQVFILSIHTYPNIVDAGLQLLLFTHIGRIMLHKIIWSHGHIFGEELYMQLHNRWCCHAK